MGDTQNGRLKYLFEFAIKPSHLARSAAKDLRSRFEFLSSTCPSPTTSGQDSGDWESPSEAVWNCDLHDRFVRRDLCRVRSGPAIGGSCQRRAIILHISGTGAIRDQRRRSFVLQSSS